MWYTQAWSPISVILCVCICVYVCVVAYTMMLRSPKRMLGIPLYYSPYSLETRFLLSLELGHKSQGFLYLHLAQFRVIVSCTLTPTFWCICWDLGWGLQAFVASTITHLAVSPTPLLFPCTIENGNKMRLGQNYKPRKWSSEESGQRRRKLSMLRKLSPAVILETVTESHLLPSTA